VKYVVELYSGYYLSDDEDGRPSVAFVKDAAKTYKTELRATIACSYAKELFPNVDHSQSKVVRVN